MRNSAPELWQNKLFLLEAAFVCKVYHSNKPGDQHEEKREKTENSMEKQLLAKSKQRAYKPYLVNYKCNSRHITALKDWVSLNPEPSVLICWLTSAILESGSWGRGIDMSLANLTSVEAAYQAIHGNHLCYCCGKTQWEQATWGWKGLLHPTTLE